jgi:uncharacterized protein YjbJ (UPF0337 family)
VDKDGPAGTANEASHPAKEAIGRSVDEANLKASRKREKSRGKFQNDVGAWKDTLGK